MGLSYNDLSTTTKVHKKGDADSKKRLCEKIDWQ